MKNHWIEKEKAEEQKRLKDMQQYGAGLWDWQQNAYTIYMDKLESDRKERMKNFSLTSSQL